jgi:hypothetical protein
MCEEQKKDENEEKNDEDMEEEQMCKIFFVKAF